jgi:hypothetical protein
MNESIIEFFPTHENIELYKDIIKAQGIQVCQSKISKQWINDSISKSSFGYLYITPIAQSGRRSLRRKSDKFYLHGFIACRTDENATSVWIDLVCSRERSKIGKLLMEISENRIKSIKNIKSIKLYSLYDEKLKKWYNNIGFSAESVRIWDAKPKAYLMEKYI